MNRVFVTVTPASLKKVLSAIFCFSVAKPSQERRTSHRLTYGVLAGKRMYQEALHSGDMRCIFTRELLRATFAWH